MTVGLTKVTMAKDTGKAELLATTGDAGTIVNAVVKALSIVGFRGAATFVATANNGSKIWTTVVTFTDDLPEGVYNTTTHYGGS